MEQVPYFRLSAFYTVYFAAIGALLPYWSLYLESLGFNAGEIGELIAILVGAKVIAPNFWGWIVDRSGKTIQVIRITSLIATIAFLGNFLVTGFLWMAGVTLIFSFFWNAALPQFEALTLAHLKQHAHQYSRVRMGGSIGFVVSVLTVGWFFTTHPISELPRVIALLLTGIWLSSLIVPNKPTHTSRSADANELTAILRQPVVIAFLIVVCLVQVAHGPYYVFYSIFLKDHGYSSGEIGALWSLGVIAEIVLFIYMPRLLKRYNLRIILLVSVLGGIARWWFIAYCVDQPWLLAMAQLLHALTFGSTHIAAIHLVHRFFPATSHGRGQALYSSMSFGLGGMIGSFASGALWNHFTPIVVYGLASAICILAFLIAFQWIRIDDGAGFEPAEEPLINEEL